MFGQETHRIYQKKACYEERLVASFGVSPLNCHSSLCAARQSDKESPLCEAQNKMKMPNLTHFVRSGHDKNSNLVRAIRNLLFAKRKIR